MQNRCLNVVVTRSLSLLAVSYGLIGCVVGPEEDEQPDDEYAECTSDACGGPYGQAATGTTYYSRGDTTSGWDIYDTSPAGGAFRVVSDPDRGSVMQFVSEGTHNGFRVRTADLKPWGNTTQFNLEWWQKFSTPFVIYVSVNTSGGQRYLMYTARATNDLGSAQYIHHGLGASSSDGTWRQFRRDLRADLRDAQPSLTLLSVNAFLVRGSGNVDDIGLSSPAPTSTSVCIKRPNGVTVRVDQAAITAGGNPGSDAVVVQGGTAITSTRGGQVIFLENGGRYTSTGSGGNLVFVARGGAADIDFGGGGQSVFAQAGSTVSCSDAGGGGNTLYYETGANLGNCVGQVNTVNQSVTDTFSRCAPTTVTNQFYPTPQFSVSRSGQVVTVSNQTTGTFTDVSWKVFASNREIWRYQEALLAASSVESGFTWTIPSNLETQYPESAGWSWMVVLIGTDPFGRTGGWVFHEIPRSSSPPPPPPTEVSFARQIQPIFNAKCVRCHDSAPLVLLPGISYSALVLRDSRACFTPLVVPNVADRSGLIGKLTPGGYLCSGDSMSQYVTAAELGLIRTWIDEGAKNN